MLLVSLSTAKAAASFSDLVAASALLAEADSGTLLFNHNMDARRPADALTKIMTLLLVVTACEKGDADPRDLIEMTDTAWLDINANSTTLGISPGESMMLLDLMYCAFMGGANEACNMIAEHIAGSIAVFVENMNTRAVELGCANTNYVNTHGQYHDRQYTTAQDQFLVFREAMNHPLFAEITGEYRYTTGITNMSEPRNLVSPNSLLNTSGKYYFSSCTAGAFSATYEGGYSIVAFAAADELSLISVVLGSDIIILEDESTQMRNLTESRRLLEWGFAEFGWRTVLSTSDFVARASVLNGAGADFVNLRPETEIRLILGNDVPLEQFVRTVTIYSEASDEPLMAPISAGDILGEVTLTYNGIKYGPILLLAKTDVGLNRLVYIKTQIADMLATRTARIIIWILVVLVLLYVSLVIRYNVIRRRRLRRIKEAKRRLIAERQGLDEDEDQYE